MTVKHRVHAASVVEARLGRPPRDVIEAAIVLEAWMGAAAEPAMATAREIVPAGRSRPGVKGRVISADDDAEPLPAATGGGSA